MINIRGIAIGNRYLNQNTLAIKKGQPKTKKDLDKKEVKSKWVAKACVVLATNQNKL